MKFILSWKIVRGFNLFFMGLFLFLNGTAQLSSEHKGFLDGVQDSLKSLSYDMINASTSEKRQGASETLIPTLVKALQTPYSYYYPFDSLGQISILYDQDSTFRIFTWGISLSDVFYRFYGAIQMNTSDGELKLFPLFDNSQYMQDEDAITSYKAWPGALYYKLLENESKGEKIYTLIGWAGFTMRTNTKVLEPLTFKNEEPRFGYPIFDLTDDSVHAGVRNRFYLKYAREGNAMMNYDPEENLIIYDHLISLKKQPEDSSTLVPDGTYEGFKWERGLWKHISKVYEDEGDQEVPIPQPFQFRENTEPLK